MFENILFFKNTFDTRVTSIGIWYPIFRFLAILAVITNGLQVAITSNMIPRIMWAVREGSMSGYAESTFSAFNVTDFDTGVGPLPEVVQGTMFENTTECRFVLMSLSFLP